MEYTKELILQNWLLLNGNCTHQVKSQANQYLTLFKKSANVLQICTELFLTNKDNDSRFLATLFIYHHIKEHISTIIHSKDSYNQCKQFLLSNLFPLLNDCSEIVISNVCHSITIIVLSGCVTYWFDSIDNLIEMSSVSEEYCHYATIILENCHKELTEMTINPKQIMAIKDVCISHSNMIKVFIIDLLSKIQSGSQQQHNIFKHILELTCSWIKFKVNILSIPSFPQMLFSELVKNNRSIISEILCDSFNCSLTSITSLSSKYPNEKIISILESKAEQGELNTIYQIIQMIMNLYNNYSNKQLNESEEELLYFTANIYSSLCKEYVYLFFANDNTSDLLMKLFLFFISHRKRKISYLFFDFIEKMKDFLIQQHPFTSSNQHEQKEKFLKFIFTIDDAIINNIQLETMTIDYAEIDNKFKKQYIQSPKDLLMIMEEEEEDNIQNEIEDITIGYYRKTSRDTFGDIFIIIKENYTQETIQNYLTRKGDMLIKYNNNPIDPSDPLILSNHLYLRISEAILYSIRQIKYCFTVYTIDISLLTNFAKFILSTQLINNEKIMINIILFLNTISDIVVIDQELYVKSIQFLLSIMTKNAIIEKASAMIILDITSHSKEMNQTVYENLSNYYLNGYHHLSTNTLGNICTSLMKSVITGNNSNNTQMIANVIMQIMKSVNDAFNSINLNNLLNEIDQNMNLILIKNFSIYSTVIKFIGSLSKEILYEIFNQTNEIILKYSNAIISLHSYQRDLVIPIITLFTSLCLQLKEYSLYYFEQINNIIFTIYSKSNEEYQVIYLMKALYHEALKQTSSPQCNLVSEKLCMVITQIYNNYSSIKNNQMDTLKLFTSFLALMLDNIYTFPNNSFDWDIMNKVVELLIKTNSEIIEGNVIHNILKVFTRLCSCKAIPMNFKMGQLKNLICGVFYFMDHYETKIIIREITNFIIEVRRIDKTILENGMIEIYGKEIGIVVIDYYEKYCDEESKEKIDKMIYDLCEIKRGKINKSVFDRYAIEVKAASHMISSISKY